MCSAPSCIAVVPAACPPGGDSPSSSSAALLGLNETVLFLGPQLHLSVAGATALVAKLHGGPVVVAALLQQEGDRWGEGSMRRHGRGHPGNTADMVSPALGRRAAPPSGAC